MKQKLDHYSKKKLHVCLPHGVIYPSIVRGPCRGEINGWFAHESGIIEAHRSSRTKQTWTVLLRRSAYKIWVFKRTPCLLSIRHRSFRSDKGSCHLAELNHAR